MGMTRVRIGPDQLQDSIRDYVRTQDVITLRPSQTVAEALATVRAHGSQEQILYFYVVDDDGTLVGVVPARRLLVSAPEATIASIMIDEVVAIPAWATVLVACEYFINRRFLAFPVVEDDGKLVGVVDVGLFTDDVIELARRQFEGIFQIIGVHATSGRTSWEGFKDRFPWLLCNVGGGLLAALIAGSFEWLLEEVVVLALFIPVVLALAESVSIQSVTLTIQGLHSGPLDWRLFWRSLRREAGTALLLGLGCGLLLTLIVWAWKGSIFVGAVVGGAIWASMITAAAVGFVLPTLLYAWKADPRIAAGPIALALADMAALMFYFNLARRILH
jgi:magnesium transporter